MFNILFLTFQYINRIIVREFFFYFEKGFFYFALFRMEYLLKRNTTKQNSIQLLLFLFFQFKQTNH